MKNVKKSTFNLKTYETLSSTNSELKKMEQEQTPWFTIRAINQTAGRGRSQRNWLSTAGKDLTFSTIFPVSDSLLTILPNVTQIVAAAVVKTLESYNMSPKIKWPNDILINGRKICGILVEGSFSQGRQRLIAGVGLNINSEAQQIAGIMTTSIKEETKKESDISEVLHSIVTNMQDLTRRIDIEGIQFLIQILNYYLAYQGEEKELLIDGKRYRAIIEMVSPTGELIIIRDGIRQEICSGEISFKL